MPGKKKTIMLCRIPLTAPTAADFADLHPISDQFDSRKSELVFFLLLFASWDWTACNYACNCCACNYACVILRCIRRIE